MPSRYKVMRERGLRIHIYGSYNFPPFFSPKSVKDSKMSKYTNWRIETERASNITLL